jgi:hypothetical protein
LFALAEDSDQPCADLAIRNLESALDLRQFGIRQIHLLGHASKK